MSTKAMSAFMYATIMTNARILTSFGIGIYNYNRVQNAYNQCEIKLAINENKIEEFETLSGCKLYEAPNVTINQS